MNDLRTAAQQAMEALEAMQSYAAAERKGLRICDEAITALRAALAQQAEPVYWEVRCTAHPKWMRVDKQQFDEYVAHGWEGQRLYTAPPQQAEPVAGRAFLERILTAMEGVIDVADRKTDEFDALRSCVIDLTVMLHAAPPQRTMVPLTEEEIYHATGHCGVSKYTAVNITRAVERAHGIKE